jgi:hypothetical protein
MGLPGCRRERRWAEWGRTRRVLPSGIGAAPFEEEMMPGSRSKDESCTRRHIGLSAAGFAVCLTAATFAAGAARAESANAIPQFASADFGWQSNLEDWEDPPSGAGHGPIKNDPAYPFLNNAEGNRAGTGATKRITNTKDPVLKPWAATQIQATNDEILHGVRDIPFTAQGRCYPGGVPGQLLWPFEPVYFIQTPEEVWMIWQRDHLVRRIFLTDKHSAQVTPSWFGESIGHYENGDTLVVDTVGLSAKISYIDNFRTPHSEKLHVVERFTIAPGGKGMSALVKVEDPDTFNAPLTMTRRWFKFEGAMLETVCPENNGDFFKQNLFPQPEAQTPDF